MLLGYQGERVEEHRWDLKQTQRRVQRHHHKDESHAFQVDERHERRPETSYKKKLPVCVCIKVRHRFSSIEHSNNFEPCRCFIERTVIAEPTANVMNVNRKGHFDLFPLAMPSYLSFLLDSLLLAPLLLASAA